MKIIRSYKTEIKPNNNQKILLIKNCGVARYAYNWALNIKKKAFDNKTKIPNAIELHKELCLLKKTSLSWMYEASKCSPQEALRNCDKAFINFFNKCKKKIKGKKGFPKFKSKKNGLGNFKLHGKIKIFEKYIQLPKIGKIKLKESNYIPLNNKILSVSVGEKAERWFISVQIEQEINLLNKQESIIGVDLGIKTLVTCSDGKCFDNPKIFKNNLEKLQRRSKQLNKKVKESKNRKKAAKKLARLYYKISCIRKDNLHKITSYLTKNKSKIVIEDLNVSGIMKNRRLSRSIADLGLFEFRRQLGYKGKWYNCKIIIANRFYPSSKLCSNCGVIKEDLLLSDRVYNCECGNNINRDLNAAINLEKYTVGSTGINAFGDKSSDFFAKKSETIINELGTK